MTKLFDLQYFDLHDGEVDKLYQFVNFDFADDEKINNEKDLAVYLLPNVQTSAVNVNKLKSFLYSLNLVLHDIAMLQELTQLHGKYEAFKCYKRIVVKFAIEIIQLANNTDYLTYELFSKTPSPSIGDGIAQSDMVHRLMNQLDLDNCDDNNANFTKIFFWTSSMFLYFSQLLRFILLKSLFLLRKEINQRLC